MKTLPCEADMVGMACVVVRITHDTGFTIHGLDTQRPGIRQQHGDLHPEVAKLVDDLQAVHVHCVLRAFRTRRASRITVYSCAGVSVTGFSMDLQLQGYDVFMLLSENANSSCIACEILTIV